MLTPHRNRHLYSIPLAEAKLCLAVEKWPRRATLQSAGMVETWDSSSCRDPEEMGRDSGGEEGKKGSGGEERKKKKERVARWHLGGGVKFIGTR